MANKADALFEYKLQRMSLAQLALADVQVGANAPAEVTVPAPGPGLIVVPMFIRATAQLRGSGMRSLLSAVLNTLAEELDERELSIARLDTDDNVVSDQLTPLDHHSDFDRGLQMSLEVGGLDALPNLANTALRLKFNGVNSTYERQYILLNYKILAPVRVD